MKKRKPDLLNWTDFQSNMSYIYKKSGSNRVKNAPKYSKHNAPT